MRNLYLLHFSEHDFDIDLYFQGHFTTSVLDGHCPLSLNILEVCLT